MGNHGCVNGTLDGGNYSSVVPVIGLYIAAASSVCMLLMLYDIVAGIRARKRWLPCKSFTLNSIILTLLAVAAKIPVDLTTAMPSPQDQLSKLTGTTFICIAMGFLVPSLGNRSKSDCWPNMVALSIFVITVVVNMCMQLFTGVIVLFVVEHIIILVCMLLLLNLLWYPSWDIHNRNRLRADKIKNGFTAGNGSMFQRLQLCYQHSYYSNAQLLICKHPIHAMVGLISLICSFTVIQAAIRTLILKDLKFCSGPSDYDWSMSSIVVSQIITVLVGSFAISFRWITLFYKIRFSDLESGETDVIFRILILRVGILRVGSDKYRYILASVNFAIVGVMMLLIMLLQFLIMLPFILLWCLLSLAIRLYCSDKEAPAEVAEEGDGELDRWLLQKSLDDMKRWMKVCNSESWRHLPQLLSRSSSAHRLHHMEVRDRSYPDKLGINVSSLSIVLLVRITQVSIPDNLCASLVHAFSEAIETAHFIEETIYPKTYANKNKLIFAKAVWRGSDFSILLPKIFEGVSTSDQPQSELKRAIFIIERLVDINPCDIVWEEVKVIVGMIIGSRRYSSVEELYTFLEQLFVDMVHVLFAQLPNAIFKRLSESPDEEYEDRVRFALKLLCKFEQLEDQVQWFFPVECGTLRLITPGPGAPSDLQNQQHDDMSADASVIVVSGGKDGVTEDASNNAATNNDNNVEILVGN